ncbi:MAG: hypothetical protein PHY05_01640 [Methanothrix sp.]|nr:hypothetical protein [Methanothrix sp.]
MKAHVRYHIKALMHQFLCSPRYRITFHVFSSRSWPAGGLLD